MALTKMSKSVTNIQSLSDLPNTTDGLTSAELKARFDKAGMDLKDYLNATLTEELDTKIRTIENDADALALVVNHIQETMLSYLDIYPIGAIYISTSNVDPGTLFGGTWQRIEDAFLLASGSTYEAGTTGGEAVHTLTVDELPSHNHGININAPTKATTGGSTGIWPYQNADSSHKSTNNTGGGQAHNNMPPYLAVYVWERIS